jgi:hypothetical protein
MKIPLKARFNAPASMKYGVAAEDSSTFGSMEFKL